MRTAIVAFAALFSASCAFGSGSYGGSSSSTTWGWSATVREDVDLFGEIVVSVMDPSIASGYLNVHLRLCCIVSTKVTDGAADAREGAAFARRAAPSIMVAVSDSLASLREFKPGDLSTVRDSVRATAMTELQAVLATIPRSELYEYRIGFGSFYLTS